MGIQLDERAYQKLIDENIVALEKYMPEHSLEKKHSIEVLKWSVKEIYHNNNNNIDISKIEIGNIDNIVKLYIELWLKTGDTKLQSQINFIEYLIKLITTPMLISILNSLKELQANKRSNSLDNI